MELKKEIMPLYSMVLVELYKENPYEQLETETGLKLTAGAFDNPDTGNRDKKEFNSTAAHIIEVGPDCKYAHAGDDCFIDLRATRPICFRGNYYFITAEQNIVALLGDELSERFKKSYGRKNLFYTR